MGNKTPGKSPGTSTSSVDSPLRPGVADNVPTLRPDGPPRFDPDTAAVLRLPDLHGASRPSPEAAPALTSAVSVADAAAQPAATPTPKSRPLRYYRIPAAIHLPDADVQGFHVFQGRQLVAVQGGFVHVGIDPETGQYRARLASETLPSGPVVERIGETTMWRELAETSSKVYRSAIEDGTEIRQAREQDMESDHSDDDYVLASESMPIAAYSPKELRLMRHPTPHSFIDNRLGSYDRANNGRYPLRDSRGRPIRIRKIGSKGISDSGADYRAAAVKPYIQFEGYEAVGRLYEEKLEVRRFTVADAQVTQELAMVGQMMVVANRRIAKGEALGIYGGTVMPLKFISPEHQTFTMFVGEAVRYGAGNLIQEPLVILGDNATSRINSNFEYDDRGKPVRQLSTGYNVETVGFNVEADLILGDTAVRKPYLLTALFASEDIPAGKELRMDYHYSDQEMSWVFR